MKDIDNFGLNSRSITDNPNEQTFEDYYAERERADLLRPIIAKIEERIAKLMAINEKLEDADRTIYGNEMMIIAYANVLKLLQGE